MYLDMILAGRRSNYLDEEDPAQDDSRSPARDPSEPASPSRSPVSPPAASPPPAAPASGPAPPPVAPAAPRGLVAAGLDMRQTMWLAGGSSLPSVISRSDADIPAQGLPVSSERAGGESRRTGLKRKASQITRSAAEDFALLTSRTTSARDAADFLSTVGNVSIVFLPTYQ